MPDFRITTTEQPDAVRIEIMIREDDAADRAWLAALIEKHVEGLLGRCLQS